MILEKEGAENYIENIRSLTHEQLVCLISRTLTLVAQLQQNLQEAHQEIQALKGQKIALEKEILDLKTSLELMRKEKFGRKSERRIPRVRPFFFNSNRTGSGSGGGGEKKKKLSERYPHATVVEEEIRMKILPDCKSCGSTMEESGMTEDSEQMHVIPKTTHLSMRLLP